MVSDVHARSGGPAPVKALVIVLLLCFSAVPLLGLAPAAHAASAHVLLAAHANSQNNRISSLAVTLSGTITAGDLLVVAIAAPSIVSVTDSLGPPSTFALAAGNGGTGIYYARLASSATTDTVTVVISSAVPFFTLSAYEVSDVSTAGVRTSTGAKAGCTVSFGTCPNSFSTSSTVSYSSGAFLVGVLLDTGEPASFTATPTFSSYQSVLASGFTEHEVANSSGSTDFPGSDASGGGGSWYEAGAAFPIKASVSQPPPVPIPSADAPAVLHLTTYGGTKVTGYRVSLDGSVATYNIPAIDQTTLGSQLASGDFSLLPMAVTACSTTIDGSSYIRVSGFSTMSWGGSSTNSTEFVFGGWESALFPAQGWPSTPACGTS